MINTTKGKEVNENLTQSLHFIEKFEIAVYGIE